MFGYIMPLREELKLREIAVYESYYCGVCRALGGRYGLLRRSVLSYDCAFLALVNACVEHDGAKTEIERCVYNPLKRKGMAQGAALDYAADVNVLLAYHKARDAWKDDKRVDALMQREVLAGAAKRAAGSNDRLADVIASRMRWLSALELRRCDVPDEVADTFAGILRAVFENMPEVSEKQRYVAGWMGYNLGRWIYLADAYDDREKDQKHGAYNVFNIKYKSDGEALEAAKFQLEISLSEAQNAYELLDIQANAPIIENILYDACTARTAKVLKLEGA